MKRENKSHSRRVNARRVARLKARYRGASKRVKTLKGRDVEMTDIINNRSVVRLVNGVSQRVKLSKPELDDLRVRRNDLRNELVKARQDLKDFKADYSEAVTSNKEASHKQLDETRKSIKAKSAKNILDEVKRILTEAAGNGGKKDVIALLEDAKSSMTAAEFKKHVKATTGVYVPKYVDLSKLRDVLLNWEVNVPMETVSE
jgi:hypothetical protein